jgi:ubiquinone/menaquinone biosynthesis C-methylase UbiE
MKNIGIHLQREHYNQTAALYDERISEQDEHGLALRYVASLARQYGLSTFLDVGCGTGRGVRFLQKEGFDVRGIEPVKALLDIAIEKHGVDPDILKCGDGQKLPYTDHSIDAVCEFAVLHHVKKPEEVVSEMIRVAKHAIFISDENRYGRGPSWWRITKFIWWKLGVFPLGFWLMTNGKGYNESDGDGISYSYSVYDSYPLLAKWADSIFFIPLKPQTGRLSHPLLTSSHLLMCAIKHPDATAKNGA